MDVKSELNISESPSGQSLVELLLLLPVLTGMILILLRINTAIQMSVVDQQYARAQTIFIAQNSPYYPRREFLPEMIQGGVNQLIIGVSENNNSGGDEYVSSSKFVPQSSEQMVARSKALAGGIPDAGQEADKTGYVRIRDTVSLCTQSNVISGGQKTTELKSSSLNEAGFDATGFMYCASGSFKMEPQ